MTVNTCESPVNPYAPEAVLSASSAFRRLTRDLATRHVAMYMGRPVTQSNDMHRVKRFIENTARRGAGPGRKFEWTATGKLMVIIDERKQFTGWELIAVLPVGVM